MSELSLIEMLSLAGKRMSNDLKEKLISHPGELGTAREEVIRKFLRSYLPKRFEISTGFVFDSKGFLSQQIDIIIADSSVCPRFETTGDKRIYPCECVVAVGQVRSSLTSISKLHEALDNLMSVKSLDRSADGKAFDLRYEEQLDHKTNYLHQIFTFLFIIGRALTADTVRKELFFNRIDRDEPHLWTNLVLALDKYLITFCCDDGVCPNPMHARGVSAQLASNEQDILLRFYILLGRAIEVTRVSGLPYWEYLSNLGQWKGDVLHHLQDDPDEPPPYLSGL
jgi:hypothetical protein